MVAAKRVTDLSSTLSAQLVPELAMQPAAHAGLAVTVKCRWAQTTLLRGLYEELCMTRGYLEAIAERMGGGIKASQVPQLTILCSDTG